VALKNHLYGVRFWREVEMAMKVTKQWSLLLEKRKKSFNINCSR
jgi:hypothetical protein